MYDADWGKVVIAILEDKVEKVLGEDAIKELKKPVLSREIRKSIEDATKRAEDRWIAEYPDAQITAAIQQMPMHNLPSVQSAIRELYDSPANPKAVAILTKQVRSILPNSYSSEQVKEAVASYLDILRIELVSIDTLRDKLNTIANLESVKNSATTIEELQNIKQILLFQLNYQDQIRPISESLPTGEDGGNEFARLIDLLIYHHKIRQGKSAQFPNEYKGTLLTENAEREYIHLRLDQSTLYVYLYELTLNENIRNEISFLIDNIIKSKANLELEQIFSEVEGTDTRSGRSKPSAKKLTIKIPAAVKHLIIVTSRDITNYDPYQSISDLDWYENMRSKYEEQINIELWGFSKLLSLIKLVPAICLFYYPELLENGLTRRATLKDTTLRYIRNLLNAYHRIEFVGMSVYKQEATRGIPIEEIYIPLSVTQAEYLDLQPEIGNINPLQLLKPGSASVILGDPGSGKSTLLRFLALTGYSQSLQDRYHSSPEKRLPVVITLRRYADELKSRENLSLIEYIQEYIRADFSLPTADFDFFAYYLETGQSILLFDGLDELPNNAFKELIRNRIQSLMTTYPGNTIIVTSRIVGYETSFHFDDKQFIHYFIAKLKLPEMEQFVRDWYSARIEDAIERDANINDLIRILRSEHNVSINQLAENPLLLTIITLVHRIDAVLPDERVVLYQKCTETLLNTWHTWKYRGIDTRGKDKLDRRNRRRLEVIAYWMHQRAGIALSKARAIVSFEDLRSFLANYIAEVEKPNDQEYDSEDLATDFLRFVQNRVGLLIEVGDNQYSFLHVSFQEYLTASYIKTSSEIGGLNSIWNTIGTHLDDARWNEVIRLLLAGLSSYEAQEMLIERIMGNIQYQKVNNVLLLGGILVDGVRAAEAKSPAIMTYLLEAAMNVKDKKSLSQMLNVIQVSSNKTKNNSISLIDSLNKLWQSTQDDQIKINLALVAYSLGNLDFEIDNLLQYHPIQDPFLQGLLRLFFAKSLDSKYSSYLKESIDQLCVLQDAICLCGGISSLAVLCQAVISAYDKKLFYKRAFQLPMTALSVDDNMKRFIEYFEYHARMFGESKFNLKISPSEQYLREIKNRLRGKSRIETDISSLHDVNDINIPTFLDQESLAQSLVKSFSRHKVEQNLWDVVNLLNNKVVMDEAEYYKFTSKIQSLTSGLATDEMLSIAYRSRSKTAKSRLLMAIYRVRADSRSLFPYLRSFKSLLIELIGKVPDLVVWKTFPRRGEYFLPFLNLLILNFELKPVPQWLEALSVRFLPKIPELLASQNRSAMEITRTLKPSHSMDDSQIYVTAWRILLDLLLLSFGEKSSKNNKLLLKDSFVTLTRSIDEPVLKLVNCMRDIVLGDKLCQTDLKSMVFSKEQPYQKIFKSIYWFPLDDGKIKSRQEKV